jgi:hypothetical protein
MTNIGLIQSMPDMSSAAGRKSAYRQLGPWFARKTAVDII